MQKSNLKLSFLLLAILLPCSSLAQMFSVDDDLQRNTNPFAPYIRVGLQPTDFDFTGDVNALQTNAPLSFSGTVGTFGFESGGFDLGLSFGNNWTSLDNRRFFSIALKFTNPFYLIRQQRFGLGVPLQLGTKLTSVRSDDIDTEFAQTNLHAGAGLTGILLFPEKFSISGKFLPSVGFSTASGGFVGGNVFSLTGKARINFFDVFFGRNLSLGYDYIYDSYNIDGEEYDYDLKGHSITLGISL